MWKEKKVSVVFSTYNEKETIREQIEEFFKTGFVDEVIAVDNNAIEGTKSEILKTKAKYFHEPRQGIGYGYQRAIREATGDIIITTEVDGTYEPSDILKLLAYSDDFDVVCGTRTTSIMIGEGANMGFLIKWANWFWAKIVEVLFNTSNLTDVGCIYRLMSRHAYEKIKQAKMHKKNPFNIDWMLQIIRNNITFIEAPVNFNKRTGESKGASNYWKAFLVAMEMLATIIKHRFNIIKLDKIEHKYDLLSTDKKKIFLNSSEIKLNWARESEKKGKHNIHKVLIIGASGKLGSQLMKDFSKDYDVAGTYYKNRKRGDLIYLDITNSENVKKVFEQENPDIVIITAAKTDVEKSESNLEDTFKTNIQGLKNITNLCQDKKVIFYSTDSVFDGTKKEYSEEDTPNPVNNYSISKLEGENLIKKIPYHLICRTARLYGTERDSPKFINFVARTLRERKEIKAPVDTLGNPSFIPDVSKATLKLVNKNKHGIYHVVGSDPHSLYEMALKVAQVFGFDSSLVIPVEKNYFNTNVKRPNSILKIDKLNNEGITMSTLEEGLKKIKSYQDKYKELKNCRICGNKNLTNYLDLGETPLANSYVTKLEDEEEVFPLRVLLCEECLLSQLDIVVNPSVLFRNYAYRSSISNSFHDHCNDFAKELNESNIIEQGDLVLDIASNDGTLLKKFKARGNKVLGIDPAINIAEIANKEGIETLPNFWTPDLAKKLLSIRGTAKIITAFNVFAHVHDLHSFVGAVKILLDKEGYFIIEAPHLLKLIEKNAFDTIYHEHLSYLLVKPIQKLMALHGLKISKVDETDIHGGSIRIYIEHKDKPGRFDNSVQKIIEKEENSGLYSKKAYLDFREKVLNIREELVGSLSKLKQQGKIIGGFGASAKGNTLLNYFGINNQMVDYIFDSTPEKQNKFTPGANIPIIDANLLMEKNPDYLLLLAWNFAPEIIEKTKTYKDKGGKYIIPIPKIKVI